MNSSITLDIESLPDDLKKRFEEVDPMRWINTLDKTKINNVYKNKPLKLTPNKPLIIILIGPSGAGKDISIDGILNEGIVVQSVTATTRPRRIGENEPEDKYTWMTEDIFPEESFKEYETRLAEKYDLIEHDFHHGHVYGLPRANLEKAAQTGKPVIIRTENRGLDVLKEELGQDYNLVSILITAPDYQTLLKRIYTRDDVLIRMQKAPEEIDDAKLKVNFVLLNSDDALNTDEAISKTQNSMKELVLSLINDPLSL